MRTIRAAVILAGALAFLFGLRAFGRSYSMTKWPVIPGRVLRSEVIAGESGRFRAEVEYEFILAGRVRRGIMPEPAPTRAAAESLVARYPAGSEIPVGFDPGDPSQSVLRPHLRWWSLALTVAGACLIALGIWPRKALT